MKALQKTLKNAGKFSTLTVRRENGSTVKYNAKVRSVTDNYVYFLDLAQYVDRRVPTHRVVTAKSGDLAYGKR